MNIEFVIEPDREFISANGENVLFRDLKLSEGVEGRYQVSSIEELKEYLPFFKNEKAVSVGAVLSCSGLPVEKLDFFSLMSRYAVSQSSGADDANLEVAINSSPIELGGWAPVKRFNDLIYATSLKKPRDIALIEGLFEFVVSDEFLAKVHDIVPAVYGVPLFSGKRRDKRAKGVQQLAVDAVSLPCVVDHSVADLRGYGVKAVKGSGYKHLGWPTLPRDMTATPYGILRSAEPWSSFLGAGWIVRKDVGELLARVSKHVELYPVLTEGSELHKVYDELWTVARSVVDKFTNVRWTPAWKLRDCQLEISGVRC